jgi:hypothetical protein
MQELITLQLEEGMQVVLKMVVLGNGRKVEQVGISLHFFIFPQTLVIKFFPQTLVIKLLLLSPQHSNLLPNFGYINGYRNESNLHKVIIQ